MEKNKNFILAVALSFAVVIGWDLLFLQPQMEQKRKQQQIEATQNAPKPAQSETAGPGMPAASPGNPAASGQPALPAAFATREEAIAASPRIVIDSPALQGSINLKGARIDDVILRNYHETVNPKSPEVVLLIHFLATPE